MLERAITSVRTIDPGSEEPPATRARLKDAFPAGAARRMTQLGMLVGAALDAVGPQPGDAIVYASRFGEGRALETFLESFPTPSPTLFQTSIHPSGVQQGLIARQRATTEVFPIAGSPAMVAQALLAALLTPTPRAIFCGGEERGTWLTAHGAASERTFAFALVLSSAGGVADGCGRLALEPGDVQGELTLESWFDLLHSRRPFAGAIAPGWRLTLHWS